MGLRSDDLALLGLLPKASHVRFVRSLVRTVPTICLSDARNKGFSSARTDCIARSIDPKHGDVKAEIHESHEAFSRYLARYCRLNH